MQLCNGGLFKEPTHLLMQQQRQRSSLMKRLIPPYSRGTLTLM